MGFTRIKGGKPLLISDAEKWLKWARKYEKYQKKK